MPTYTPQLSLTVMGVPPYSCRGLVESIAPIDGAASMVRDINGILIDLSRDSWRKFAVSISGSRQHQPPSTAAVWPGQEVTIDCISELSYPTAGGLPASFTGGNYNGRDV